MGSSLCKPVWKVPRECRQLPLVTENIDRGRVVAYIVSSRVPDGQIQQGSVPGVVRHQLWPAAMLDGFPRVYAIALAAPEEVMGVVTGVGMTGAGVRGIGKSGEGNGSF